MVITGALIRSLLFKRCAITSFSYTRLSFFQTLVSRDDFFRGPGNVPTWVNALLGTTHLPKSFFQLDDFNLQETYTVIYLIEGFVLCN